MRGDTRGQSHVIGVAVLMGITVIALAGLTAGIGTLVESNAASADSTRVADDLSTALEPVETTGHHRGEVGFTDGRLRTVEREVRILNETGVVRRVDAGGLVFEAGDRRVSYVDDAIVRQSGTNTWLHEPPSLTTGRDGGVLIASVARLNASDVAVSGERSSAVTLATNVSHERTELGTDTYGVAIETKTPRPLERWFRERNATVSRRDFDGDGVESVVGRFPGNRTGYLVVHDMHLEVADG
ncbi:DUF7289 family protein [Halorientalis salina]|uniref:DUF7289 family protein n=1 Tax=Halorientalis salina TaxID=2932266 RepID=UPI0010AB5003|nr:hypothetical protein [Halorientalis salina]